MKGKPKLEVRIFLTKRDIVAGDMKSYYVWQQVIEAMQEYAELYHKEKLRDELRAYDDWYYMNAASFVTTNMTEDQIIDEYLKQKE